VLVYQWHDLPGRGARKLAREDGDVPTMQGIPTDSVFHSGLTLQVPAVFCREGETGFCNSIYETSEFLPIV
jgi:hypothetical protein